MKKYFYQILLSLLTCLLFTSLNATANNTELYIGNITATEGETVEVPVILSGNTGICGANIRIAYDSNLQLVGITNGSALSTLTMTKPGDMTSNPFTLVWDGMEEDCSDGTIAVLTFKVPSNVGKYNVSLSYDEGDIVNNTLTPVSVGLKNGSITVSGAQPPASGTTLTIESVTAKPGESITVPVRLAGNTGICGATLNFKYHSSLTLTNISKGDGLSTLNMTKPGSYSPGPFVLVWDGLEADTSNGVIAYLTFTAPEAEGDYSVSLSFEDGDIVDGSLTPVKVIPIQGKITVTSVNRINVQINGTAYTLNGQENAEGLILISFYDEQGKFLSFKKFNSKSQINVSSPQKAKTAKLMWWDNLHTLKPICEAQKIELIK